MKIGRTAEAFRELPPWKTKTHTTSRVGSDFGPTGSCAFSKERPLGIDGLRDDGFLRSGNRNEISGAVLREIGD